ncbi:B3 DNA binding domain [Macleaya cordata]|uniref:B3 DNA binding domain n=1 Tax=Macleaya cordata TaxID=56857 RepID=A0A200QDU7_MACCD|nr:B3 DNA binding domain [Macleaya cordata]
MMRKEILRFPFDWYPRVVVNLAEKNTLSKPWIKVLKSSDVNDGQGRLMIQSEFAEKHIERIILKKKGEDSQVGIQVSVFNGDLRKYKMVYKRWVKDKGVYVLTSGWNHFYKSSQLKVNSIIRLWAFRHVVTKKLCFAITY